MGKLPPAVFLLLGLLLSYWVSSEGKKSFKLWGTRLLQLSIVLLGVKVPFLSLLQAGASSLTLTSASLLVTAVFGALLWRILGVSPGQAKLMTVGTGICGGSAIAAAAPAIRASPVDLAVSLSVVFILNAVALLVFPLLGSLLQLSPEAYGWWCALAIHDTSSVVGAASAFGERALQVATTAKLTRTLWIFPITLGLSFWSQRQRADVGTSTLAKPPFPKFILGFLLTSALVSLLPGEVANSATVLAARNFLVQLSILGFSLSLFGIGASVQLQELRKSGLRPVAFGVLLWGLTIVSSYWLIVKLSKPFLLGA